MSIVMRAYGKPQPKGSVSAFYNKALHRMQRFDSNRGGKAWREQVKEAFVAATGWEEGAPPANDRDVAIAMHVVFWLPKPKKPKYREALAKPDLDKLLRGVLDALLGLAYVDDAQVKSITTFKTYAGDGEEPGALIIVGADTKGETQ